MKLAVRSALVLVASLSLSFPLAGCSGGPKLTKVKGKITRNNQPLNARNGSVDIVFTPVDAGLAYDTYPANYNQQDGTYEVPGKDGKGIPPGKYRITIHIMTAPPLPAEATQINNTYGSDNSPLVREVTGEDINIDLAKARPS